MNCVSPGTIKSTRIQAILAGEDTRPEVIRFWEDREEILKRIPLPRIGLIQDVANLVAFLGSDISNYITGLQVHGIHNDPGFLPCIPFRIFKNTDPEIYIFKPLLCCWF